MDVFERADGQRIDVVRGFRRGAKSVRPTFTPRPEWSDDAYAASADKRVKRFERLLAEIRRFQPSLRDATILEIGCGNGINCMLLAEQGARRVVGIDLFLALLDAGETGVRTRTLAEATLRRANIDGDVTRLLRRGSVALEQMDARKLDFADDSFDLLLSRSAMEHIAPIQTAIAEMVRVVKPGGLMHHSVDPFYWLGGCHKGGITDIPWAHARLTDAEFERFVRQQESDEKAARRLERIQTLNRYPLHQWREILTAGAVDVLEYREEPNDWSLETLRRYPDAAKTLLPGVTTQDLTVGRINVWLRKRRA